MPELCKCTICISFQNNLKECRICQNTVSWRCPTTASGELHLGIISWGSCKVPPLAPEPGPAVLEDKRPVAGIHTNAIPTSPPFALRAVSLGLSQNPSQSYECSHPAGNRKWWKSFAVNTFWTRNTSHTLHSKGSPNPGPGWSQALLVFTLKSDQRNQVR